MSIGIGVLAAMTAMVLLPGCQSGKDIQISELQRQVDDLQMQRGDLESRLAAALNGGDQARQMALSLQQQLDECNRQLAAGMNTQAELPAGWKGSGSIAWIDVANDILYDSGKATLKPEGLDAIRAIAATIQAEFPNRQIWVIGHTDNDPIKHSAKLWSDNLDLSLNRAATVGRELYKLGLPPEDVSSPARVSIAPRCPTIPRPTRRSTPSRDHCRPDAEPIAALCEAV